MTIIQVLILSFVEGITEFLPISSTGHLILTSNLLRIQQTEFVKSFEIIIQLGAIVAVAIMYFKKLTSDKNLWKPVFIAFIPSGIFGLTLYKLIKKYLIGNSLVVVASLLIGGIILILFEKYIQSKRHSGKQNAHPESDSGQDGYRTVTRQARMTMEKLTLKQSLTIGLFQSISMIPGVSRAAATIIGGMVVGFDRNTAVEFSFLLAIPTMAAATGLDLVKSGFSFSRQEFLLLGIGFIGAFITAWFAVKYFLRFVQTHTLASFGVYRIALALLFLIISSPIL